MTIRETYIIVEDGLREANTQMEADRDDDGQHACHHAIQTTKHSRPQLPE